MNRIYQVSGYKTMECGYRDSDRRRWSLCLKDADPQLEGTLDCDLKSMEVCDNRSETPQSFEHVERLRTVLCSTCSSCGGTHRSVREHMVCRSLRAAEGIISGLPVKMPHATERVRESAWPKIRSLVLMRDDHTCLECGSDLSSRPGWLVEVHHVIPRSRGGDDDPRNLKTLCTDCHRPRTEILRASLLPKDDSERQEMHLKRKFRDGRDMLIRLGQDRF